MFKEKNDLVKILDHVEKVAGKKIRSYPKNIRDEAISEAIIAVLEDRDILEHLKLWRRAERRYQNKILSFTRARPTKRDKEQIKKISKDYK